MSQSNGNGQCEADRLVENHMDFARALARRMLGALPFPVDRDALESDAMLGLLSAARCFDPHRGAAFTTYAAKRIRGAMLDGWRRRQGHAPGRCYGKSAHSSGRLDGLEDCGRDIAQLPDVHQEPIEESLERQDQLQHLLGGLSAGQRRMVRQFYFEHLTQQQIGRRWGISASRVCQRLQKAKKQMAQLAGVNLGSI